ncbi:MAG: hypothetical protein KatS3mg082_1986 [Nitrospiraceae bacterium]|nr:MAG: hypothetical protein KatS3mg082_1986 [Nitrospiraceae bacterium]
MRGERKRIEALIERNLAGGRVELHVDTKDGLSYVVSRSVGEEPMVLTADGQPTEVAVQAGGFFRADIFSQNEVRVDRRSQYLAARPARQLRVGAV